MSLQTLVLQTIVLLVYYYYYYQYIIRTNIVYTNGNFANLTTDPLLEQWAFFHYGYVGDVIGSELGCLMNWCEAARCMGKWNLVVCVIRA
jgi:hypothetical protein